MHGEKIDRFNVGGLAETFPEQFEEAYVLTITVEGNGIVHINPQKTAYKQGENVTLTAIAGEGYDFAGWSGEIESQESSITITMTKNTIITAHFTLKRWP